MQKAISTLVGMLTAAAVLQSHAAGLQVSPTSLSLPAKQRAGIFTLGNKGTEPLTAQNVFIVSASAVNYRHEQKNLPKRYQSRAICASPSPAGKCP